MDVRKSPRKKRDKYVKIYSTLTTGIGSGGAKIKEAIDLANAPYEAFHYDLDDGLREINNGNKKEGIEILESSAALMGEKKGPIFSFFIGQAFYDAWAAAPDKENQRDLWELSGKYLLTGISSKGKGFFRHFHRAFQDYKVKDAETAEGTADLLHSLALNHQEQITDTTFDLVVSKAVAYYKESIRKTPKGQEREEKIKEMCKKAESSLNTYADLLEASINGKRTKYLTEMYGLFESLDHDNPRNPLVLLGFATASFMRVDWISNKDYAFPGTGTDDNKVSLDALYYKKGEELFRQAIEAAEGDAEALTQIGKRLAEFKQYALAIEAYEAANEVKSNKDILNIIAHLQYLKDGVVIEGDRITILGGLKEVEPLTRAPIHWSTFEDQRDDPGILSSRAGDQDSTTSQRPGEISPVGAEFASLNPDAQDLSSIVASLQSILKEVDAGELAPQRRNTLLDGVRLLLGRAATLPEITGNENIKGLINDVSSSDVGPYPLDPSDLENLIVRLESIEFSNPQRRIELRKELEELSLETIVTIGGMSSDDERLGWGLTSEAKIEYSLDIIAELLDRGQEEKKAFMAEVKKLEKTSSEEAKRLLERLEGREIATISPEWVVFHHKENREIEYSGHASTYMAGAHSDWMNAAYALPYFDLAIKYWPDLVEHGRANLKGQYFGFWKTQLSNFEMLTWRSMAQAYSATGQHTEAERCRRNAEGLIEAVKIWDNAFKLLKLGKKDKAEKEFDIVLEKIGPVIGSRIMRLIKEDCVRVEFHGIAEENLTPYTAKDIRNRLLALGFSAAEITNDMLAGIIFNKSFRDLAPNAQDAIKQANQWHGVLR